MAQCDKIAPSDLHMIENNKKSSVSDLSVVPLGKDSLVICERCGILGFRNKFYPKNPLYCSISCYASTSRRKKNAKARFHLMGSTEHLVGMVPLEPLPQLETPWPATLTDLQVERRPIPTTIANSYEWKDELFGCDFLAAPVSLFKHAPLHDMWDNTFEGMKVEVKNIDCESYSDRLSDYFWVATVIKVKGYMGLLRYEGFGSDDSKDFWVNLCCSEVHPVGWCATRGKPLIPPRSIEDKYSDWKKFLVKQLTGARTLPANFYSKLADSLKSRFTVGTIMEVVNKNRISQVKVASVYEIVGKRLHVKYYDSSPEDNGFWCHEDSPLIHPVGWAFQVGHTLDAPSSYLERVASGRLGSQDATQDMFYRHPGSDHPLFCEGMKLEAIDPLNLSSICAATVMQVLNEGFMMIKIDAYPADASGGDWFCYHQRSPCIFPVGFSVANNIQLRPPHGWTKEEFSWSRYLAACEAVSAGPELFAPRESISHGFVAGMRLECADLMDPRLVCVATIARVLSDMLKVHFDGWGVEYDQWLWARSTDVYPVGWCKAVGHRLEGPLQPPPRRPRPQRPARRPRRTAKAKIRTSSQGSHNTEENSQNSDIVDRITHSPAIESPISNHTENSQPMEQESDIDHQHSNEGIQADVDNSHTEDENMHEIESIHPEIASMQQEIKNLQSEIASLQPEMQRLENLKAESLKRENERSHSNHGSSHSNHGSSQSSHESSQSNNDNSQSNHESSQSNNDNSQSTHDNSQSNHESLQPEFDNMISDENNDYKEEEVIDKVIPRLVNNSIVPQETFQLVDPENWTSSDVAKFLSVNDCAPYCDNFTQITGAIMLQLSKDEIIELLEMKVGPSLKIFDLIQQLKSKIKPQNRMSFK